MHIYYNSVGGNATFLLNIPPTREGLFHEKDVKRLKEMGDHIRSVFAVNLLDEADLCVKVGDTSDDKNGIENVRADGYEQFFKPEDGIRQVEIVASFPEAVTVSHVVLKENILMSQRIESFEIRNEKGAFLYQGTTVGYKKIAVFPAVQVKELHIKITDARVCPALSFIGVY